jgi:hypothetical protein
VTQAEGGKGPNQGERARGTQERYERWSQNVGGTEPELALLKHGEMPRTSNRRTRIKRV